MKFKLTRIYQPAPWPVSPEPPAGRPGPPCFLPTQYLDSHSRHWPVVGLKMNTNKKTNEKSECNKEKLSLCIRECVTGTEKNCLAHCVLFHAFFR